MPKLDSNRVRAIVRQEILQSVGYVGGELSEQRRKALDYYHGEPFGNELEGRSAVISMDVQDTIESIMPDFIEIFGSGDQTAKFEPTSEEDEQFAEQATDYVRHIVFKDNDGWGVIHDWIKDALLQKNGLVKVWWNKTSEKKRETLSNVNSAQLMELDQDSEIEIVEQEEKPVTPELMELAPDGLLWDLVIVREREIGRVVLDPVPPEEFLIARRAISLDRAPFTCHRVRRTVSELVEMGYSRELVEGLPAYDEETYNEERISRFNLDDEWPQEHQYLDPALKEIWVYECYMKLDYNQDGIAQMHQVTVAGPGYTILPDPESNQDVVEIDDHPFVAITPIRMPHKFFGRSVADLIMDVQLVKSTLLRQTMDNIYNVNNNRNAVNERVNMDDLLNNRPNQIIQVSGDEPIDGSIMPITTQPIIQHTGPMMEYWDNIRESRTGATRVNQGIDPESVNKTARGLSMLLGRTQRRMLLIARTFAEMGFRPMYSKILRLVVNHQDQSRVIRLRNTWVPMDPRAWNIDMDVTIQVGLSFGTKESRVAMLERIIGYQIKGLELQGGANGPMIELKHLHNSLSRLTNESGYPDSDMFFGDPEEGEQPQQQPNPEAMEAQMKAQMEAQKLQLEQAKLEQEDRHHQDEMTIKQQELEAKFGVDVEKLKVEREKAQQSNGAGTSPGDFDITAVADRFSNANQMLATVAQQVSQAVNELGRPKEIIRDGNGRIVGTR